MLLLASLQEADAFMEKELEKRKAKKIAVEKKIYDLLDTMSAEELLDIYTAYIDETGNDFVRIYHTDDVLAMMLHIKEGKEAPIDDTLFFLLAGIDNWNFDRTADYCSVTPYRVEGLKDGDLFNFIYTDEIAEYCAKNGCSLGNSEIQAILAGERTN